MAKHDFCVFSKENLCCSDIHEPYATCILCMHKSHMSVCHDDMSSINTRSSWSCAGGAEGRGEGGGMEPPVGVAQIIPSTVLYIA